MFMHWQIKKVVMVKFDLNLDLTLSLDVMWQRNWYKWKDRMSMLVRENQWCVARRQSWLSELCSLSIITWILQGRSYQWMQRGNQYNYVGHNYWEYEYLSGTQIMYAGLRSERYKYQLTADRTRSVRVAVRERAGSSFLTAVTDCGPQWLTADRSELWQFLTESWSSCWSSCTVHGS